MTDDPLVGSVGRLVAQVGVRHRALAARLLSDVGVHPGQELLLGLLWRRDGRMQSELAAHARVEPATISRMVVRLERSGLIARRPDPDDGRVQRVWLTDRGRQVRGGVHAAWVELEEATVAGLDDDERAALRLLLRRVRRNLAAAVDRDRRRGAASGGCG